MPQSLSAVYVHLIFSTHDRIPFLEDLGIRKESHEYIAGTSKNLGCPAVIVGGVSDHVHVLAHLGRTISMSDWIRDLKRSSSGWLKSQCHPNFGWQHGYGTFSVSQSDVRGVQAYIQNQEEHHKRFSFKEELLAILKQHGLPYNEQYLWD